MNEPNCDRHLLNAYGEPIDVHGPGELACEHVRAARGILGWCDTLNRETELQGQVHQLQRIIIEIRQHGCEAVVDGVLADHGLRIPAVLKGK